MFEHDDSFDAFDFPASGFLGYGFTNYDQGRVCKFHCARANARVLITHKTSIRSRA